MSKKLWLAVILILQARVILAQTQTQVTQAVLNKNGGGNDREVWSGYFSGLIDMVGTDGKSSIQLNTTLYALAHLNQLAHNDSLIFGETYRKQWYLRNLQINGGFTPDSKEQLRINTVSYGLKFALMNNKTLTKKERDNYNTALNNYLVQVNIPVSGILAAYAANHPDQASLIHAFQRQGNTVAIKDLPQPLLNILMKQFNKDKPEDLKDIFTPDVYFKQLTADLKTKTTWTISGNSHYDEVKSQVNDYILSSALIFYGSRKDTSVQYNISASYTWAADTTQKTSGLVRLVTDVTAGPNFSFKKIKWFELKTGIDYVYINGPLYKKEHENTWNLALTPRFKISKNFWLPVALKYNVFDNKDRRLQGQFSVQYSLK